jgi:hypothetical protein
MKNDKESEYVTRDNILKLLTDDELASVSTAEGATRVADGDEYLDLDQLDQGVLRGRGVNTVPMGRVLTKKAVHANTWATILTKLPAAARP